MSEDKNEQQQQDYLSKFVNNTEEIKDNIKEINEKLTIGDSPSLEYLNVDISVLPLGIFYKPGTKIRIRAAKVQEIQNYSVVDDKNMVDVTEKMNQLLSSCVKITFPNGNVGSYKDLKDGDRLFLIFMIRELTFQKGPSLAKDVTCDSCEHEFKIPFRSTNGTEQKKSLIKHEMPDKLDKFFNKELRCFEFNVNNVIWRLAPPSIGIQEIFFENIKTKVQTEKKPNVSFLKIIPYTLYNKSKISDDGIKVKEQEFKALDMYTFQFLNQAVDKMIFGLKGLEMTCPECGSEVHTDMTFPNGASSIFMLPDVFDDFIEK